MNISSIMDTLDISLVGGRAGINKEASSCYCGDLLSVVMANLPESSVWITVLGHVNIIAVASLCQASCIIISEGVSPSPEAVKKADEEEIPIFTSNKSSFELAKELVGLGL